MTSRLILKLYDYNIELRVCDFYVTMILQLLFFLDRSFVKYIIIFINSLVKNLLIQ